jgi:hypothetical protein
MHASSEIWIHDPSVRASEDTSYLDRAATMIGYYVFIYSLFNNALEYHRLIVHWPLKMYPLGQRYVQEAWTAGGLLLPDMTMANPV